jgi:hypothetical protein
LFEDFVRGSEYFEALGGVRLGADVWVPLLGETAIGAFDLLRGGGRAQAKDGVEPPRGVRGRAALVLAGPGSGAGYLVGRRGRDGYGVVVGGLEPGAEDVFREGD